MKKTIAIFDFDKTITESDSLMIFLNLAIGPFKAKFFLLSAIASALISGLFQGFSKNYNFRTAAKKKWLSLALKGKDPATDFNFLTTLCKNTIWKKKMITALKIHYRQGEQIAIATGALDLYIKTLIKALESYIGGGFKVHHLICTKMKRDEKGILTGKMKSVNSVRDEKKQLVEKLLQKEGPFKTIYGYGNAPCDLPFLSLCDKQNIV